MLSGTTFPHSRWMIFFIVCCCMCSYSVNRHILVPIQDQLIDYYSINNVEYNLLQSLYSWPNAIGGTLCGILIIKIGVNNVILLTIFVSMIGILIMSISASPSLVNDYGYILLCLSRIIVGVGNESLSVSMIVFITTRIFEKNRHAFALGVYIGAIAGFKSLNATITYQIYAASNSMQICLSWPLLIPPILSSPFIVYLLYSKCHKNDQDILSNNDGETERSSLMDETDTTKDEKSILQKILSLPMVYWMWLICGVLITVTHQTFGNVFVSFLRNMYGYSSNVATSLATAGGFISLGIVPLCGIFTDKYGMKCKLLLISTVCTLIGHYLYGWVHIDLSITIVTIVIFMIGSGIGSAVYWSGISAVINNDKSGIAFGVSRSVMFTSIGIGYVIVGALTNDTDDDKKYIKAQYFQIGITTLCAILALMILMSKSSEKLELPLTERKFTEFERLTEPTDQIELKNQPKENQTH